MNKPPTPPNSSPPQFATFSTTTRSPRFAGPPPDYRPSSCSTGPSRSFGSPSPANYAFPINLGLHSPLPYAQPQMSMKPAPPPPSHPLLTPSGHALANGGKVQNVSNDPLAPCIIYWPDNEPFPEQGQIRPGGLVTSHVRLQLVRILMIYLNNHLS